MDLRGGRAEAAPPHAQAEPAGQRPDQRHPADLEPAGDAQHPGAGQAADVLHMGGEGRGFDQRRQPVRHLVGEVGLTVAHREPVQPGRPVGEEAEVPGDEGVVGHPVAAVGRGRDDHVGGDVPVDGAAPPVDLLQLRPLEEVGRPQREALVTPYEEEVEHGPGRCGDGRSQSVQVLHQLEVVPVVLPPGPDGVHGRVPGGALAVLVDARVDQGESGGENEGGDADVGVLEVDALREADAVSTQIGQVEELVAGARAVHQLGRLGNARERPVALSEVVLPGPAGRLGERLHRAHDDLSAGGERRVQHAFESGGRQHVVGVAERDARTGRAVHPEVARRSGAAPVAHEHRGVGMPKGEVRAEPVRTVAAAVVDEDDLAALEDGLRRDGVQALLEVLLHVVDRHDQRDVIGIHARQDPFADGATGDGDLIGRRPSRVRRDPRSVREC